MLRNARLQEHATMRVDKDTYLKIKMEAAKQQTSIKNLMASIVAVAIREDEPEEENARVLASE